MEKNGKNLTDLLDMNRAQILKYLAHHPECSRAELGAITGLTLPSITKIVRGLQENGIIYETGFAEGKKGRRSVGLSISYDKFKVLAVKLSWQRLKISIFDISGEKYGEDISFPFESITLDSIENIMTILIDGIRQFQNEFPEIVAIGLAVPGPFYKKDGSLLLPPYTKNPEKRIYYSIEEKLKEKISLPVFIEHDADAGALAYWWFYTSCDREQGIMNIIASAGIGGGIVENGNVFSWNHGNSCELGHISIKYDGRKCHCGSTGCIDAYSSFRSIQELASQMLPDYPDSALGKHPSISVQTFFSAVKQKDTLAIKLLKDAGRYLGYAIVSLLSVFNPDIVLISDIMAMGGDLFLDEIKNAMISVQSTFSRIPELHLFDPTQDLVLLGAATIAINSILSEPTKYLIRTKADT